MKQYLSIVCFMLVSALFAQEQTITVRKVVKLMGTRFEITVVAEDQDIGDIYINEAIAEIQRLEQLISSWNPDSETSKINKYAGIKPVAVSPELFQLIERSIKLSEITSGAFDISYASLDEVWKFDGSMDYKPTEQQIKTSIAKIGYQNIHLNKEKQTVFLTKKGMRIGFGAVGKGFAADKVKELMVSKGVVGGIINAAGDLTTWGAQASGDSWVVGITNPLNTEKVFSWIPIVESSVATSGNYEKFVSINNEKYSHIIDPRTGYPAKGINSVSVFAKKAELCDALATAVFIMGKDSGMHLINQIDGVEVVVVDAANRVHKSSGILMDVKQIP
ncbi:FAD:protein FMN transferase [Flavobacterium sp. ASW18X]|uniref:FAD:protein FMN transferase n=1 Tax=Flavobacterium sp. ASW18X TaxID=2572595 RepID=UPI001F0F2380|nr:FAD:protein FMN transferase [Flavobacterium sp. ASW18X]